MLNTVKGSEYKQVSMLFFKEKGRVMHQTV